MADRPPPVVDELPIVSYEISVRSSWASYRLIVQARFLHQAPGEGTPQRGYFNQIEDISVSEPSWLARLFGDTIDRRIDRAKATLARRAEREIEKRKRMDRVLARYRDG